MSLLDLIKKKKKVEEITSVTKVEEEAKKEGGEKQFVEGLVSTKDIIAPAAVEVDFNHIRIDNKYYRTCFVAGYPRFAGLNWLSPLINFDASLKISMYIYPTDGKEILDDLRRKIAEMEAEISTDIQRGKVVNPATQAKLEDALTLQADLVKGEERFFQFGLYMTLAATTKEELDKITKNLEAALGALMIISKRATLQMEEGFSTTLPLCSDKLNITRNMDTTSLANTFPFVSSDLSDDKGIMYGINEHNGSLVIFDRFSMQNYNSVVFASAGAGKSYMIKLEVMRLLMLGTDIIVVDPENEYRNLAESVGGQYIAFGYGEESKINPFDLSLVVEEGENALNDKVLTLHKMFKIMLGAMDPMEESLLDRAVMEAYKAKGITPDPETQQKEAPLIEDLYKALIGMEEERSKNLAARLEKYIKGSFAGIFNQKTTVNLKNAFVVFGIRNLEESLRPVAMHIILDYIWTTVKKELKKRVLVVDEAWYLMQYDDSAAFLRGIVKRGRKYYLGVTTITQDVDDFLETPYGKEIVTNSAIQILMKQHSAAIDTVGDVFYLSEGEKQLLLSADKGEGIFFAGQNHVAIKVIASDEEHALITSNPEELMKQKAKLAAKIDESLPSPKFPNKVVKKVVKAETEALEEKPVVAKEKTAPIEAPITQKEDKPLENVVENKAEDTVIPQSQTTTPPAPLVEEKKEDLNQNNEGETKAKVLYRPEVEVSPEEILQKRIAEMEENEKRELEEHHKKVESEKKPEEKFGGNLMGGLPKYQELFKSSEAKLPPLPPLPKFEAPKQTGSSLPKFDMKKPSFLNQTKETTVPQPPQLAKKPKIEFVDKKDEERENANNSTTLTDEQKQEPVKTGPVETKTTEQNDNTKQEVKKAEKSDDLTMTYDKLFGNSDKD
ncbi:ATP-binding protein [Patescibacteria group bacterium]|nr:ATP-binding protein [Patescibacteria group bacterium]